MHAGASFKETPLPTEPTVARIPGSGPVLGAIKKQMGGPRRAGALRQTLGVRCAHAMMMMCCRVCKPKLRLGRQQTVSVRFRNSRGASAGTLASRWRNGASNASTGGGVARSVVLAPLNLAALVGWFYVLGTVCTGSFDGADFWRLQLLVRTLEGICVFEVGESVSSAMR